MQTDLRPTPAASTVPDGPAIPVRELFFPSGPEGELALAISLVIAFLALLAMGALALFALRLARNRRILEQGRRDPGPWRARVREARQQGAPVPAPTARWGLARRAWEVAQSGAAEGIALLTSAEDARIEASAPLVFARYVGGTLVLLGLTGTLIGLSTGVFGLRGFFSSLGGQGGGLPAEHELIGAILEIIGGLRTAFSTTLTGVAGTILLRLATTWLGGRILAYLAELDAFTATVLLPEARPAMDSSITRAADSVTRLESQIAAVASLLESSATRLDAVVGTDAPPGSLAGHTAALQAAVQTLHDSLREQKQLAAGLRDQIVAGVSGAMEAAGSSFRTGVDAQRKALQELHAMKERELQASEQLQQFLGALMPMEERVAALVTTVGTAAQRMNAAADAEARVLHAIEGVSRQLDETASELRAAGQQMAKASSDSEEFRDVLDASLTQFGRALNRISVFDERERLVAGED